MTTTDLTPLDIIEIVGDFELPCDFGHGPLTTRVIGEHDDPARWVMHLKTCSCGKKGARLACTRCKDLRTRGDIVLECSNCGTAHVGGSDAYSYIEPLEKK